MLLRAPELKAIITIIRISYFTSGLAQKHCTFQRSQKATVVCGGPGQAAAPGRMSPAANGRAGKAMVALGLLGLHAGVSDKDGYPKRKPSNSSLDKISLISQ